MKTIIRDFFSRPVFQSFFESILNFSLKVLNIGEGQSVETSGEKSVFKILDKISTDNMSIIFDVGAHTGEWFRLFKKFYTKKSMVYSFEPSIKSYLELSLLKEAGFHPENLALGDRTEKKMLFSRVSGSSTAYIGDIKNTKTQYSEEISIITLDKYCLEHNIKSIDLLKLDVEGYELKILNGSKNMIENDNIKLIQFEFGAPSEEKYTFKDFFDILGKKY